MDFKQQIFDALKAKFQGVNANVLNRIATMLAKTVTTAEQVTTAVAGVTKEYIEVIESYGDSRATEAAQTAVNNYETQHNLKDGKPVEQGGGQQGGGTGAQGGATTVNSQNGGADNTTNQLLQQLLDQNKKFQERLDKMDGERTTATRRQELDGIIGKLPENLRKPYERTTLDTLTDEQWNTLKGEIQTEVEGLASTLNAKGAVFGKPAAQHGGASSQQGELTQEQQDAIAKRENAPKDGQPF